MRTRLQLALCFSVALGPSALGLGDVDSIGPDEKPELPGQSPAGSDPIRSFSLRGDWKVQFGPSGFLYPRYLADPRRPTLGVSSIETSSSEIAGAGNSRYGVRIGQRFGIARFFQGDDFEHGFQLEGEVGFSGQFDQDNSTDNIGWDGLYGLYLTWLGERGVSLRFGMFHDSSHIGDEYIESTGRTRINYTREEVLLGASWSFADHWLAYGEFGHGFGLRNEDLMEPGRYQLGLEFRRRPRAWGGNAGWYTAADVSAYEEDSWDTNVTLQLGLLAGEPEESTLWRLGLEYYDGRSQIGEFFQDRESYLAWGIWLDW